MSVFGDLEEVTAFWRGQGSKAPVIEDEEFDPGEFFEEARITAVASRQGEFLEEPRQARIQDGFPIPAGLVGESAGDPALSETGGACDEEVLVSPDPASFGEARENGAIDTAWRAQVDVLDAGIMTQAGELETGDKASCIAIGSLLIGEHRDALLEGQNLAGGSSALFLEGSGHAGEAKGDEAFVGGMVQQG